MATTLSVNAHCKIRPGKADRHVKAWADSVDAAELYVSVITLQELEIGVMLMERRDAVQGAMFRAWLDNPPGYAGVAKSSCQSRRQGAIDADS